MSNHVGTVGKRETFALKVLSALPKDGEYGPYHITKMEDENGNRVTWFKSGTEPLTVGRVYLVSATVKKHDTWVPPRSNVRYLSTVITRGTVHDDYADFGAWLDRRTEATDAAAPVGTLDISADVEKVYAEADAAEAEAKAKKTEEEDTLAALAACRAMLDI